MYAIREIGIKAVADLRSKILDVRPLSVKLSSFSCSYWKHLPKEECIPVGCVPSATVAVCFRGVSLQPPGADPPPPRSRPPRAEPHWEQNTPPQSRPSWEQAPTPCGKACWDNTPPCCKACWDITCNVCWDTTTTTTTPSRLWTERQTRVKKITFATSLRTVIICWRSGPPWRPLSWKSWILH